jgi:hypothetical protein
LIIAIVVTGLIVKSEVAVMVLNHFYGAIDFFMMFVSPYCIVHSAVAATSPDTRKLGVGGFAVF